MANETEKDYLEIFGIEPKAPPQDRESEISNYLEEFGVTSETDEPEIDQDREIEVNKYLNDFGVTPEEKPLIDVDLDKVTSMDDYLDTITGRTDEPTEIGPPPEEMTIIPKLETSVPSSTQVDIGQPQAQPEQAIKPLRKGIPPVEPEGIIVPEGTIPTRKPIPSTPLAATLVGATDPIPFVGPKGIDVDRLRKEHPGSVTVGGTLTQLGLAVIGGTGVAALLGKTALSKTPMLLNAVSRGITGGGIRGAKSVENVIEGKETIKEALFNTIIESAGGAAFSVLPEIKMSTSAIQLVLQPLADIMYQAGVDAIKEGDQGVFSKQWFIDQIPNAVAAAGFAAVDVGKARKLEGEPTKPIEASKGSDVPKGQEKVTEPLVPDTEPVATKSKPVEPKAEEPSPEKKVQDVAEKAKGSQPQAGQIAAGQKLPEKMEGVNLKKFINDKLENLDEKTFNKKKLIVDTADEFRPIINEARRDKITHEETQKMADHLGMTEKTLLKRQKGEAYNAEQLTRANDILETSSDRILDLHEKLAKKGLGNITEEDIANMNVEMYRHVAVQAEFAGARAEAGRSLSALRIISKSLKDKGYEKIFDAFGGKDMNRQMMEKLLAINPKDEAAVNNFLKSRVKASFPDMMHEYWVNSILSGLSTHAVNITGNALFAATKPLIETPIAALLEAPKALLGKQRNVFFRQIPREIAGFFEGMPEGFRAALEAFKTETPIFDQRSKIESLKFKSIPDINLGKLKIPLGSAIRVPGRALMAADEFFKNIVYRSSFNTQAYQAARKTGKKGQDFIDEMVQIKQNPPEAMVKKAKDEAAKRTFTNPLGDFGNKIMNLRSDIVTKKGGRIFNPLKLVIPFVRTPMNIAKRAIERTPVGFIEKLIKIRNKDIKIEEISEEMAKPLAGTAMLISAAMLAQQGIITGRGPENKRKRHALYKTGWMPYSVKLGDKYYSFARLEPIGSLFGMAADFVTLKKKDEDLLDIGGRVAETVGKNVLSKTYMRGLSDFVNAASNYDRYGETYIQRMAGSLVPNIIASGARASDATMRKVDNIRDVYQSRIPGLSQHLHARRDIWGKEIDRAGNFWTRFVSPVQYSAVKGDKVDRELVDIGADIGIPSEKLSLTKKELSKNDFGDDVKNIRLTGDEYEAFQIKVGKATRDKVIREMKKGSYKRKSDQDKVNKIKSIFTAERTKHRNKIREDIIARYLKERE